MRYCVSMTTIDKIYGTQKEWDQLHTWLVKNCPVVVNQLYNRPDAKEVYAEIATFDMATEQFLLYHCPLESIKSKIRKKHGLYNQSLRHKCTPNSLERNIQKYKLYEE